MWPCYPPQRRAPDSKCDPPPTCPKCVHSCSHKRNPRTQGARSTITVLRTSATGSIDVLYDLYVRPWCHGASYEEGWHLAECICILNDAFCRPDLSLDRCPCRQKSAKAIKSVPPHSLDLHPNCVAILLVAHPQNAKAKSSFHLQITLKLHRKIALAIALV
jgi:hypothetical protein